MTIETIPQLHMRNHIQLNLIFEKKNSCLQILLFNLESIKQLCNLDNFFTELLKFEVSLLKEFTCYLCTTVTYEYR